MGRQMQAGWTGFFYADVVTTTDKVLPVRGETSARRASARTRYRTLARPKPGTDPGACQMFR